jgi:serine/threonine protein kinase
MTEEIAPVEEQEVELKMGADEDAQVVNEAPRDSQTAPALDIELTDNFEVLELIGRGGTGQVYKVRDKQLDQILAVKVLKKDLIVDNQTVKRFNHEAEAAANLSHANVVSVYGHGETKDGSPYITMNYIEGESLATILKRDHSIPWQRVVDMMIQLCEGLEHAHEQGLIHRDLKPSNVIISTRGGIEFAHLVDFGIAKVITTRGDTLNTLTVSGEFLGTPMYMSPEQCLGQNVDHRTDVYALGCMMYEALNGSAPFAGASSVEVIAKKMSEESPILKAPGIPPNLTLIVSCCMARHSQDRYADVKALRQDLEALSKSLDPKHAQLKTGMDRSIVGRRLIASFVDYLIISSVTGVLNGVMFIFLLVFNAILLASANNVGAAEIVITILAYVFLPLLVTFGYFVGFERYRGATLGKQLCGLVVVDAYGNRLTLKQSMLRNFTKSIILIVLPLAGFAGFALPEPAFGVLTALGTFTLSMAICIRSIVTKRRLPWDILVGAQIRRR